MSLFPNRLRRRAIAVSVIALFVASMVIGYRADDWSRYDHKTVRVVEAIAGDSMRITSGNGNAATIKLLGIVAFEPAQSWLRDNVAGKQLTLLLESPQTRDSSGHLRAYAFLGNQNLSVELTKAGLAFADRREKTVMDGAIDAAESEARKKKRGMWATLRFNQMPAWRQAWVKALSARNRAAGPP